MKIYQNRALLLCKILCIFLKGCVKIFWPAHLCGGGRPDSLILKKRLRSSVIIPCLPCPAVYDCQRPLCSLRSRSKLCLAVAYCQCCVARLHKQPATPARHSTKRQPVTHVYPRCTLQPPSQARQTLNLAQTTGTDAKRGIFPGRSSKDLCTACHCPVP